jgi:hypothetical protein
MTRLLQLAALAGALGLVAGCGGGTSVQGGGEPVSFEQLTRAATTSAQAATGRFGFSMEMTVPDAPEPLAFSGEGAFDSASKRAAFTFDFSSLATLFAGLLGGLGQMEDAPDFGDPSAWKLEVVQDGHTAYMRLPAVSGEALPDGKSWVRSDLREAGEAQGFDFSQLDQFTSSDPRKMLELLRASSDRIETVGPETLRGVETTHYRATLDVRDFARVAPAGDREQLTFMLGEMVEEAEIDQLPVDVWLDETGFVRKVLMAFSATDPATSEKADVAMSFELWDFGEDVEIELPPADEVVSG